MDKYKLLAKIETEIRHMEAEGGFGIALMREVQDYIRKSDSLDDDQILRDHFAGQALPAIVSMYGCRVEDRNQAFREKDSIRISFPNDAAKFIASDAYYLADAMMAERKRLNTPSGLSVSPSPVDITKAIRDENF